MAREEERDGDFFTEEDVPDFDRDIVLLEEVSREELLDELFVATLLSPPEICLWILLMMESDFLGFIVLEYFLMSVLEDEGLSVSLFIIPRSSEDFMLRDLTVVVSRESITSGVFAVRLERDLPVLN